MADETTPNSETDLDETPTVEMATPEALEAEKSPLELVTEERDRLKDQLIRMAADFDNFRKRSRREADDARNRGFEDLLKKFLPTIDNLERAVASAAAAPDVAAVAEGVRMVLKGFEETARLLSLVKVETVGKPFNPDTHEAISIVESAEHPVGTIVAEVQPGYRFGDKLMRAAMVVVAKAPAEAPSDASTDSSSN